MTDEGYLALRSAVNAAKFWQVRNVERLKYELQRLGYSEEAINEAIETWANYEKAKP